MMYLFDLITTHTSLTPTDLRFGIKIVTETLIVFLYIICTYACIEVQKALREAPTNFFTADRKWYVSLCKNAEKTLLKRGKWVCFIPLFNYYLFAASSLAWNYIYIKCSLAMKSEEAAKPLSFCDLQRAFPGADIEKYHKVIFHEDKSIVLFEGIMSYASAAKKLQNFVQRELHINKLAELPQENKSGSLCIADIEVPIKEGHNFIITVNYAESIFKNKAKSYLKKQEERQCTSK